MEVSHEGGGRGGAYRCGRASEDVVRNDGEIRYQTPRPLGSMAKPQGRGEPERLPRERVSKCAS